MNKRADWLAWSLQFLFGSLVGASLICLPWASRHGHRFIGIPFSARGASPAFSSLLGLGGALIGGALASWFGDRFWFGGAFRISPPDEPEHSIASRTASLVVGLVGGVLVLIALARLFGLLS